MLNATLSQFGNFQKTGDRVASDATFVGEGADLERDIGRNFTALEKLQSELRNCRRKNESLSRDLESCKCELALEKEAAELKQVWFQQFITMLINLFPSASTRQFSPCSPSEAFGGRKFRSIH